jgi:hypothetical protein
MVRESDARFFLKLTIGISDMSAIQILTVLRLHFKTSHIVYYQMRSGLTRNKELFSGIRYSDCYLVPALGACVTDITSSYEYLTLPPEARLSEFDVRSFNEFFFGGNFSSTQSGLVLLAPLLSSVELEKLRRMTSLSASLSTVDMTVWDESTKFS